MVSFGGLCFENAESETRWLTCQNIKQFDKSVYAHLLYYY